MGQWICKCTKEDRKKCLYKIGSIYKCPMVVYLPDSFDSSYKKKCQQDISDNREPNGDILWR